MAVSLVGTGTFIKSTGNGNATTLTFSTGAAASGDLVIAVWTHTRPAVVTANLKSSDGTAYTSLDSSVGLANGNLRVYPAYRVLTSSEATVTSCATGNAQDSVIISAIVLRGIAGSSTISLNSTIGTSSNPNSPIVTVGKPNSAVMTIAGILSNTTLTEPTGFGSAVSTGATDTRSCAGGLAYVSTGVGTVNPSSWTGGAAAAWVAYTVTVDSTEVAAMTWLRMAYYPDMVNERMPMIGY